MMKVTVSGSFRRHMSAIYEAVTEFVELGVEVLSPADPRVVDQLGDFVFVASDLVRSIKLVEDRHLESIRASDLLWLVCPDGYVGQSAAMELGYAVAVGTPVYSTVAPSDGTLSKYVHRVGGPNSIVSRVRHPWERPAPESFLINPRATIERAHADLDAISRLLSRRPAEVDDAVADEVYQHGERIAGLFRARPSRKVEAQ
jgi:hypothetical protein